jgi:hypothetical protein
MALVFHQVLKRSLELISVKIIYALKISSFRKREREGSSEDLEGD